MSKQKNAKWMLLPLMESRAVSVILQSAKFKLFNEGSSTMQNVEK
jgi:hypothetical protein